MSEQKGEIFSYVIYRWRAKTWVLSRRAGRLWVLMWRSVWIYMILNSMKENSKLRFIMIWLFLIWFFVLQSRGWRFLLLTATREWELCVPMWWVYWRGKRGRCLLRYDLRRPILWIMFFYCGIFRFIWILFIHALLHISYLASFSCIQQAIC